MSITTVFDAGPVASFPGSATQLTPLAASAQVDIKGVGNGRVLLTFADSAAAAVAVDDVLQFYIDGTLAAAMICDRRRRLSINDGEFAGKGWEWSGPMTLGVFKRGLVGEPGGVGRDPWVDDVTFNFTHVDYVEDGGVWSPATTVCTVEFAQLNAGNVPATAGVDGRWGYLQVWAPNFPQHALAGVGSGTTEILWGPDGTTAGVTTGIGMRAARSTFTTSYDGLHYVFFACDNVGQCWIDGKPMLTAGNAVPGTIANPLTSGFTNVQIAPVSLSAGDHVIAFSVTNYPPFGAPNPAGFSAAVYIPGFPPTLVYETLSSNTHITDYVTELPGMTVTNVIRLCVEQEQAAGRLAYIDLSSFSDTQDSAATACPLVNASTKVGVDLTAFFIELMQTYCDLVMPADSWQLQVYVKDTHIAASGFTANLASENVTLLEQTRVNTAATDFLVRWQGGYAEVGTSGDWHGFVQLGPESTGGEVSRLVTQLLAVHANPREQITFGFDNKDDPAATPWVNTAFIPGNTLVTEDGDDNPVTERIISITLDFAEKTDRTTFVIDVKDRVEQEQDKIVTAVTR